MELEAADDPQLEFQFLIGTLKTMELEAADDPQLEFQFLIGTLKTSGSPACF